MTGYEELTWRRIERRSTPQKARAAAWILTAALFALTVWLVYNG